ncbi:MAG: anion permease [Anaerolineae bacterium]
MSPPVGFIILIALALSFSFLNGFQASAKIMATMISSRAMTPRAALLIAAVAEFLGPFMLGVAVARLIAEGVAAPAVFSAAMVIAALLSANLWNLLTWYLGIPSSSSHALIGGIIGAVVAGAGVEMIRMDGVWAIALALLSSPIIGFFGGYVVMRITLWLARGATPKVNLFFKRAQLPTAIALAFSYGANDAQKTMGVITLGLVVLGYQARFVVLWWVVLISATSLAIGTAIGGWRIIRTLGAKLYRIRPIHGFTSQFTSGTVVLAASLLGGPVSTTHTVSTSILGVGAAERKSQVRWGVMTEILIAWLFTVPITAGLAALFYFAIGTLLA